MKRSVVFLAAMLLSAVSWAQSSQAEFKAKYDRQVKVVGYDGVGVSFVLDKWEEAFPEDPSMLEARFKYDYLKSKTTKVVIKDQERYLGQKPVLNLADSTGKKHNYFEDLEFDDELFGTAQQFIDKALKVSPLELRFRFDKISSLLEYEKESPDMATAQLQSLIDQNASSHPAWTFDGEPMDKDEFAACIQEYCNKYFQIGSKTSLEQFKTLSEKMNKLFPKESVFLTNIGSYWLIAQKNDKKAAAMYKKALKVNPEDAAAQQNLKLIEKRKAQAKKK